MQFMFGFLLGFILGVAFLSIIAVIVADKNAKDEDVRR